jgi:hypothetical protein
MCEKAIQMLFVYSSHGLLANGNQSQDALDKDVCHVNTSPKLGDTQWLLGPSLDVLSKCHFILCIPSPF